MTAEVGFSQLVRRSPAPWAGTRPVATAPTAVPMKNGTSTDELAIISALMPTPFTFDASAQPVIDHDYLDSAAVTTAAPQQVVTYRINPKAERSLENVVANCFGR